MNINKDAFSSGQIGSKVWLCEELEKLNWQSDVTDIYGGWYGITGFLLLSRGNFNVGKIRSIDLDPQCEKVADMINENWVWQNWKFKAFTADANKWGLEADLVINTSSEHFESKEWFEKLPKGTRVVIQGNNMPHEDHHIHSNSAEEFVAMYHLSQIAFAGQKDFIYPTWRFSRYMVIGTK